MLIKINAKEVIRRDNNYGIEHCLAQTQDHKKLLRAKVLARHAIALLLENASHNAIVDVLIVQLYHDTE